MSTKFVYDGSGSGIDNQVAMLWGNGFGCAYFEVTILYGDLAETLGEPLRPSVEAPAKLPVFPLDLNSRIKAYRHRLQAWSTDDLPGKAVAELKMIDRQDLFDADGSCLGAKFVFTSGPVLQSDNSAYCTYFSISGSIQFAYGFDQIEVKLGGSGHTNIYGFND